MIISRSVLREMFVRNVEKNKTHILCSVTFSPLENRAVCEIMLKNILESGRSRVTNGACALHAGYQRPHTHTQNM